MLTQNMANNKTNVSHRVSVHNIKSQTLVRDKLYYPKYVRTFPISILSHFQRSVFFFNFHRRYTIQHTSKPFHVVKLLYGTWNCATQLYNMINFSTQFSTAKYSFKFPTVGLITTLLRCCCKYYYRFTLTLLVITHRYQVCWETVYPNWNQYVLYETVCVCATFIIFLTKSTTYTCKRFNHYESSVINKSL